MKWKSFLGDGFAPVRNCPRIGISVNIRGTVPLCETVPVVTEEIRPRIGIRGKNKELSQIIILKSHREGVLRRDAE